METDAKRTLARLILSVAAAALSGCAVYGPPYAVHDTPVVAPAPLAAPYYAYPYGDRYGYSRPSYAGPPLSLNFGYYEHRYRGAHGGHGGHGYRGRHGSGDHSHGWRGTPGGHAHGWSGWRGGRGGGYHGGGPRGGGRGHR
jgi:hypothetical protein